MQQHAINWKRTSEQMVEDVLRMNHPRLAYRYRNRLARTQDDGAAVDGGQTKGITFPELSRALARKIGPVLKVLNPVKDQRSWNLAAEAIERSLVHNGILFEDVRHIKARSRYTGEEICDLMRLNDVTIRQLAQRMNITLKRVREVREKGVVGNHYCLDWYEAITCTGVFEAP